MILKVNPATVLIKPDQLEEKTEGGLHKSPEQLQNELKKLNRGTIVNVGKDVDWLFIGEFACFYRGAASEIEDDGETYFLVRSTNVLGTMETVSL